MSEQEERIKTLEKKVKILWTMFIIGSIISVISGIISIIVYIFLFFGIVFTIIIIVVIFLGVTFSYLLGDVDIEVKNV